MALLSSSASVVPLLVPQASTWWLNSNVGYYQGVSMAEIEGLVRALREGDDAAKLAAARSLHPLVQRNASDRVLFAEAGGIPPIVELLRDGSADAKQQAANALWYLASTNDANAVEIAAAVGLEALVQLARRGRVTVENQWVVRDAALPAKRKAALVVAKLVSACVPDSVPRDIKAVIVSYLWPAATHEPASSDEEPQESDEDDSESSFFEFREDDVDY